MSAYVALARKWRSTQFSDVVGQAPIVRTLMNAIHSNRVHHAYLFTGSRGIGKTSIARLLAKALRCPELKFEDTWLKTCETCSSCKEITSGSSMDVIEIDGASNNGVDAVREIRENTRFLPSSGSRRIYIIDEVHMLTTAAFNALLKTLEEPPAHVVFIFATTEAHKIPATILSRVQRFDFRRINSAQIQSRLSMIAKEEGITIEKGALAILARSADGSMRDALSLFDQVLSFGGTKVTTEAVQDSIGMIQSEAVFELLKAVLERKPVDTLEILQEIYNKGHDLKVLARHLLESLHAVILAKVTGTPTLEESHALGIELSEEDWKRVLDLSALRELGELELIFQVLHYGVDQVSRSPQPKIVMDIFLIKCASSLPLIDAAHAEKPTPPPRSVPTPAFVPEKKPLREKIEIKTAPLPSLSLNQILGASPSPTAAPQTPALASSPKLKNWVSFVEYARKTRPHMATLLDYAHFHQIEDKSLTVKYKPQFAHKCEPLKNAPYKLQLLGLLHDFFGHAMAANFILEDSVDESPAEKRERTRTEHEDAVLKTVDEHPILKEARSLFEAELGPVELRKESPRASL